MHLIFHLHLVPAWVRLSLRRIDIIFYFHRTATPYSFCVGFSISKLPRLPSGCNRQNRGCDFLRRQILGKVVKVVKSGLSRTEDSGKCVTPVAVFRWEGDALRVDI